MPSLAALARLTDSGGFEQLVHAILQQAHPLCAHLHLTGINAHGRTIRSPIDGIAFVQHSSPPHLVFVQATTVSFVELRRKWFGSKGDIAKAVAHFEQERRRVPDARLTLILATNRLPSSQLLLEAMAVARASGVELDIWGADKLAQFLDTDGQWIRWRFFGIEQCRLSPELLSDVSRRSARDFVNEIVDDPAMWVERELDTTLVASFESGVAATFLNMPSGSGKTTALARLLEAWVREGRQGVRIPPPIAERSMTLAEAIDSIIRGFVPSLAAHSGNSLPTDSREPFLIVIDDITRCAQPIAVLERVVGWAHALEGCGPHQATPRGRSHLFCSVVTSLVDQLPERLRGFVSSRTLVKGAFERPEAVLAIQRRLAAAEQHISDMEAMEMAAALGDDPLLISMASHAPGVRSASEVIPRFIASIVSACAARFDGPVSTEFYRALRRLALAMLVNRRLTPSWDDLTVWFEGHDLDLDCLRILARQRGLCHLEGNPDHQYVLFRHDRVRNSVLAAALHRMMMLNQPLGDILSEPNYAECLGLALVSGEPIHPSWIERLRSENPLALVHALRQMGQSAPEFEQRGVDAIRHWLEQPEAQSRGTEALRLAMQAVLAETEHAAVLDLASRFAPPHAWSLQLARLRNGDAAGGAAYCSIFEPGFLRRSSHPLVDHALTRHRSTLVHQVQGLLTDTALDPQLRLGALHLAGLLGDGTLSAALAECWEAFGADPIYLSAFVWAASLCGDENLESLLRPMMDFWAGLPRERHFASSPFECRSILTDSGLQIGFSRALPAAARSFLITQLDNRALRAELVEILDWVDHPDAASAVVHAIASFAREAGTDGGAALAIQRSIRPIPGPDRPLRYESRVMLRDLWASVEGDIALRQTAFERWLPDMTQDDRSLLQQNPSWGLPVRARAPSTHAPGRPPGGLRILRRPSIGRRSIYLVGQHWLVLERRAGGRAGCRIEPQWHGA